MPPGPYAISSGLLKQPDKQEPAIDEGKPTTRLLGIDFGRRGQRILQAAENIVRYVDGITDEKGSGAGIRDVRIAPDRWARWLSLRSIGSSPARSSRFRSSERA